MGRCVRALVCVCANVVNRVVCVCARARARAIECHMSASPAPSLANLESKRRGATHSWNLRRTLACTRCEFDSGSAVALFSSLMRLLAISRALVDVTIEQTDSE